jgi:hypothetical protein
MDRRPNAWIGPAAAQIALHGVVNIIIRGRRIFRKQARRLHDLTRLAISALRHLMFDLCCLKRMQRLRRAEPFDRRDRPVHILERQLARPHRDPVHMHRAGPAGRNAAAELGAGPVQLIAQHPKQGHIPRQINAALLSIHRQNFGHARSSYILLTKLS